jgi:hypothetical protein
MLTPERIAQYEKLGPASVRAILLVWTGQDRTDAMDWLSQKDEEKRLANEASQALQAATAFSANRAAWIAAIAAIIAAIAAIATIVVELVKK